MSKTISLYYSHWCSVPGLGNMIYLVEIYLFKHLGIGILFCSGKKSLNRDRLLKLVKGKKIVFAKSYNLGRVLKDVNKTIVFDWRKAKQVHLNMNQTYDLMWSLVFANSITRRSKESLGKFVPLDFPEFPIVITQS